jgi:signal transduction histidine kinase
MSFDGDAAVASSVHERRLSPGLQAVLASAAVVLVAAAIVIGLRIANPGAEPGDANWWLIAWLVLALAYLSAGTLLVSRPEHRVLGTTFVLVAVAALVAAVSTQYLGYSQAQDGPPASPWLASLTWVRSIGMAILAAPVLLALAATSDRWSRPIRAALVGSGVAIAILLVKYLTDPWNTDVGTNPIAVTGSTARTLLDVVGGIAVAAIDLAATFAAVLLGRRWRDRSRLADDPLPGWLFAGAVVTWLAVVPTTWDLVDDHLPAPDVVPPVLLMATIPLVVVGAVIEVVRAEPWAYEGISRRALEWTLLVASIVTLYTALVAGLGRLVGGSGPTWFLVAATGILAVLVEPIRQRIRDVVDRLVYGSRDDTLSLVRGVMTHVNSVSSADELLPDLAASLGQDLRLDHVAIDVARDGRWERAATYGPDAAFEASTSTAHRRVVPLRYHDEAVGRLVVGWTNAASLRARDAAALEELAAPLALAVSWVRIADDLRRTGRAVVSAREEERRRLRRDLHDGLGPALTGISLGLRTSIRQLERRPDVDDELAAPVGLLRRLADEVDATVVEVKRIARDLRPSVLDQLGLVGALAEFTRGLDHAVQFHVALPREDPGLPAAIEVAIYRIVTEALTNVVRHAKAATCWVSMQAAESVEIEVVDDGSGFAPDTSAGVGLVAMQERVAELGGTVTLMQNVPHGTRLLVRLPAVLP